ncbi:trypsin-like peptidase domain-containing protein [Streptomyces canus]|uniref:trypsin-like peptidase domain-containing protein n=1 Tax=Streptomyces canus TaxID=58343 RepID=UPI002DDA3456|nr:trypsin-like peptidase domain-containing protein [Streptomyces canus]WSD88356.1 trypsin-like peptidase domain-containing protein [Streptomyces canus]
MTAIHLGQDDPNPRGSGFLIDARRVLTCAHVVHPGPVAHPELWVAFPKAEDLMNRRIKVQEVIAPPVELRSQQDVAVLVLEEPVSAEFAARLLRPTSKELVSKRWWAFGFPDGMLGDSAGGLIGESLGYGWVRLDNSEGDGVQAGYSGGALWSADYQAVVGLVAQGRKKDGYARAVTMRAVAACLPDQQLHLLTDWSTQDAGDVALSAWGWTLSNDPESGKHWRPRARGVGSEAERGFRFCGRAEALRAVVDWITDSDGDHRQVLLVTGSPGVGKSAVLGRVVTTADPEIAALLPEHDDALRAPTGAVACAVHARHKTALEVAREIATAACAPRPDEVEELPTLLRGALENRARGSFSILIDALDEARTPADARTIMRHIAVATAESCADLGVRVVVGSRRTDDCGDLLAPFQTALQIVDLDAPAYFAQQDLSRYALATLQLLGDERRDSPYADESVAKPVADRIAEMAQGNFLIAGLVARTHGLHDQQAMDIAQLRFTATVDAALRDYLARLQDVEGVAALEVLTALAYADSPGFTVELWREAIRAVGDSAPDERALRTFARTSAANFLVESSDPDGVTGNFRLFHQALNEALLADRTAEGALAHDEGRIARALMSLGSSDWQRAPGYLLRSLPGHAVRGGVLDELLEDEDYPLHADLRRLIPAVKAATSTLARARARLLRTTPQALDASAADRVALFSVTEAREHLGRSFRDSAVPTSYRAVWAVGAPHTDDIVLEGHTDWVNTVCAISAGGRTVLASASNDGTVRLWNPDTGEEVRVLQAHAGAVRALSPLSTKQGIFLASAGNDGAVRLWNPDTGDTRRTFEGHTGWITALCTIDWNEHTLLASAGSDGTVRLWNPDTGEEVRVLQAHAGAVRALCPLLTQQGVLLASAGNDGVVRLWEPDTGNVVQVLEDGPGWVTALCVIDLDGRTLLASARIDGPVLLQDTSGETVRTLKSAGGLLTTLHPVELDGRTLLASAGDDRLIYLQDAGTGDEVRVLEGHTDVVQGMCVVVSDGHALLASAGNDNTVRLWDAGDQGVVTMVEPLEPVEALCMIEGERGALLATVGHGGTLRLWDPGTGEARRTIKGHIGAVTALCTVEVNGRTLLASAGSDRNIRLWNPDTGEAVRVLEMKEWSVRAMCQVSSDGRVLLAAADDDGVVRLHDPDSGEILQVLPAVGLRAVLSLCSVVVGDRAYLATAWDNYTVALWDTQSATVVRELTGHTDWVRDMCVVSAQGRTLLATAAEDRTVRLWAPDTGEAVATLQGHTARVSAVCSITVGTRTVLISAGDDRTVRLWDPELAHAGAVIPVRSPVRSLASHNHSVFTGFTDGLLALALD